MADIITLSCSVCKRKNYSTYKTKKKQQDKLALSKYCWHCRKSTPHKEAK